jgi:hypothetical protein
MRSSRQMNKPANEGSYESHQPKAFVLVDSVLSLITRPFLFAAHKEIQCCEY